LACRRFTTPGARRIKQADDIATLNMEKKRNQTSLFGVVTSEDFFVTA
jgi:hypothetical protein